MRAGAGGIRGLRELIRRHGRALEADLRREYGVRLRHLFTGELTWRELSNLVAGLSPQSATRTALRGGLVEPTGEEILLADLFDAISVADWHFVTANSDEKKPKPKAPKRYPRWWEKPGQQKASKGSPERVARIEDARRRQRERRDAIRSGAIA